MIIDVTDFLERPYKIPNQDESKDFNSFLSSAEEDILISLLGYELYAAFLEGLDSSGDIAEIWTALRDGAEYEFVGKTYKYNGLKDLLKPELYSFWMTAGQYKFTNTGWLVNRPALGRDGGQVSDTIDADEFRIQYHNEFVRKVGINGNLANTFYGFMVANEENYENWEFTQPLLTNRYSL